MLVAFVGLVSGYNGSFEFKSGEQYPSNVPYISMRVLLSFFGVAMVPLGWYTAKELHFSMRARHLVACMVLFGNCKVLLIVPVSSLLSDLPRPVMAYHQSFHSSRFAAVVLHMYHGVLPDQVP
jgi:dolichyl-phosphate-mannose-protein mannosyltransferase